MISTEIPVDLSTIRQLHESRILLLGSEVTDAAADDLCAQLLLLDAVDSKRDIQLYINSPGDRDRWFTAEGAREYGFVDRVITTPQELRG